MAAVVASCFMVVLPSFSVVVEGLEEGGLATTGGRGKTTGAGGRIPQPQSGMNVLLRILL
jgi:hypothetical protein